MRLFVFYLIVLWIAALIGMIKFALFSHKTKIISILITITAFEESINLVIGLKNGIQAPVYHVFSIIEIFLTTIYFLSTIKIRNYKSYSVAAAITWLAIGITNMYFQPICVINTNMLVIESIAIIFMSSYALYKILLNDEIVNILKYPHFWIWAMFLIYWSSSFFFWGFFKLLNQKQMKVLGVISYEFHEAINIIVYACIGLIFLVYPKKSAIE